MQTIDCFAKTCLLNELNTGEMVSDQHSLQSVKTYILDVKIYIIYIYMIYYITTFIC